MKTKETKVLGRYRSKPSKIKAQYSQRTCKNYSYHCAPLYWYTIQQHRDSSVNIQ